MIKILNLKIDTIPSNSIYIGRGSPWGNPFILNKDGTREEVIKKFEDEILPFLNVEPLRGFNLVCFCAPKKCHGHSIYNKLYEKTIEDFL